jgi:hypothetical protein
MEEKQELAHEPIPKYRKIFYVTISFGTLYLIFIILSSILSSGH